MRKIIPIYYSEYGRYISKHRAIPGHIDGLKPVERRIILALKDVAQRKVKSSKVIGHLIAHYHPHGDLSAYQSLIKMTQQNYALPEQGNFGSPGLIDAKASAHRYTEVRLASWLNKYAFEYYKFVPWESTETDEKEPLYLPSPVPLGLIGEGITVGIAFHKTILPKFKKEDLLKRLKHLIDKKDPKDCIIKPNIDYCKLEEIENNGFFKLLTTGKTKIKVLPNGKITKNEIRILGRSPTKSFNSLINACQSTKKNNKKIPAKLNIYIDDLSGETIDIRIIPKKKSTDISILAKKIWDKYLISNINFNCLVVNEEGFIKNISIDELILNSYSKWKLAVLFCNVNQYKKLNKRKIDNKILEIVNYIIRKFKINNTTDVINIFEKQTTKNKINIKLYDFDKEKKEFRKSTYTITKEDIEKCCINNNIKKLIEFKNDYKRIENDLNNIAKKIINNNQYCYNLLKDF